MKFIKLTFLGTNEDTAIRNLYRYKNQWDECEKIFINTDCIIHMKPDDCYTRLKLKDNDMWVKETSEEIMKMINGAVEQLVDSETPEEIWTTKNGTPKITDEELREMMKDPKYWKDQDPEYVKKVENGFKKLYSDK